MTVRIPKGKGDGVDAPSLGGTIAALGGYEAVKSSTTAPACDTPASTRVGELRRAALCRSMRACHARRPECLLRRGGGVGVSGLTRVGGGPCRNRCRLRRTQDSRIGASCLLGAGVAHLPSRKQEGTKKMNVTQPPYLVRQLSMSGPRGLALTSNDAACPYPRWLMQEVTQ